MAPTKRAANGQRQGVGGDPTTAPTLDPPFVRWMKEQQAAEVTRRRDAMSDGGDDGDNCDESDSDDDYSRQLVAAGPLQTSQTDRVEGEAEAGREDSETEGEDDAAGEAGAGGGVAATRRVWSDSEMLELAAAVLYCRESGAVTRRAGAKGSGYWRQVRRLIRRGNPAWSRLPTAMAQQWKRMKAKYDDVRMREVAKQTTGGNQESRGDDEQVRDENQQVKDAGGQIGDADEQRQRGSNNAADELVPGSTSVGTERRKAGGNPEWYEYVDLYYGTEVKTLSGGGGNGAGRGSARATRAGAARAAAPPSEMPAYAFPESITPPTWPDSTAATAAAAATAVSSLLPLTAPATSAVSAFAAGGSDNYLLSLHNRVGRASGTPTPQLTVPQPTVDEAAGFWVRGTAQGGVAARKERRLRRRLGRRGTERQKGGARVRPGGSIAAALGERVNAAMGAAVRNACAQFEELTRELLANACAQFEELSKELAESACAELDEILAESVMHGHDATRKRRRR
ncbi:hypothetical protein CLOM_g10629 [Closterium sp. NIES-68]|nr:hypothetical protein CLOM_g10629 [Closterium sp. NIES-68]GJP86406.1 hypothetical protein CLOP_g16430 [Closterium sp. NIES-67]